jgi:2-polyprenyl-6-methoxyphenol hydroxylase-like FAD-dependent oxidoreductase
MADLPRRSAVEPEMPDLHDCDVLVAGAGPTGMSAAIALYDAGYTVRIIDRHAGGLTFSRAILVNSQTLRLLKPHGVADAIMARGRRFGSITINGPAGRIIEGSVETEDPDAIHPTALPQLETEKCLAEGLAARGVEVSRPQTLAAFADKGDYVESFIETDGVRRTIRSRMLLGADGFHSVVREGLAIAYNRSPAPLRMYSQDAVIDWSGRTDLCVWILGSGAAIAMRIGERLVRFAATDVETFRALRLGGKIEKTTWESEFDVYFAQVDAYGRGNVWLAGDAAHVHSPIGGHGMNMGIADGLRFAQAFANGNLAAYAQERHAAAHSWVRKNRIFTELMCDRTLKGDTGRATLRLIFRILATLDGRNAARRVFENIAVG